MRSRSWVTEPGAAVQTDHVRATRPSEKEGLDAPAMGLRFSADASTARSVPQRTVTGAVVADPSLQP